jgi:hypothetical protein
MPSLPNIDTVGEPFSLTARRCAARFSGMRWLAERPVATQAATASKLLCEAPQALSSQNRGVATSINIRVI